jgi:hypothetical protein
LEKFAASLDRLILAGSWETPRRKRKKRKNRKKVSAAVHRRFAKIG